MIDLFNKNKIEKLQISLSLAHEEIAELRESVRSLERWPKCYKIGQAMDEDDYLYIFGKELRAIEEFMNVEIKKKLVDNPFYGNQKPPQVEVWVAVKKGK